MRTRNKVMLLGYLGQDPESKYTPNKGTHVVRFSLGTTERYKEGNEWKTRPEWHTCIAFGRMADTIAQYLKKGSPVDVEGRLQTRSWEDKEKGGKQYRTEVILDELRMLPSANRNGNEQQGDAYEPTADETALTDEDIPF